MKGKELLIKDLNKEAKMIFGLDPENYPWFCVYEKNGKFSIVENDFGEFGMGYNPVHYTNVGNPFAYDSVRYYELESFCNPSVRGSYKLFSSNRGYIALGKNNLYDIFCLDAWYGCKPIVENVSTWDEAMQKIADRIGYGPKEWEWIDLANWRKYTPDRITSLDYNQVFVFGSNLQGNHSGGAARDALEKFGAKKGQGVGMQGQSYAIPTMFNSVEDIRPYVNDFIEYAIEHPTKKFLVTRIGCNIAGFSEKDIAPLFLYAVGVRNIILPESFVRVINQL